MIDLSPLTRVFRPSAIAVVTRKLLAQLAEGSETPRPRRRPRRTMNG